MDLATRTGVHRAVTEAGLAGIAETELLTLFCAELVGRGLPLARGTVLVDTLHPVHEGRAFLWREQEPEKTSLVEYGRISASEEAQARWRRSVFHHLLETGQPLMRCRLDRPSNGDFPMLDELRAEGHTEHVVLISRFAEERGVGEMDCVYSSWTTSHPGGFSDEQVAALTELVPSLALAVKCKSLARIAETLVETYLGADAGRRVLSGRIERGVADRIGAVLWFSDLRGYTGVADRIAPELLIPFLNDYADAIITAIHEAGGDVLKLMGDGTLAVFQADDPSVACRCALTAHRLATERVDAVSRDRGARGLPIAAAYVALHIGEVFYGNVGSRDRLDFTVVGPAVNEVSRIATMCRSVERDLLVSSAFQAAACPEQQAGLVSVGRYALRGVARPQELFTLDPGGVNG
ncbi:adenylate/guanylate cyclase domain-containing protein [Salinarimonas soli]|uniref:Adenylate/guanylate cyclase domain-containing protein n=1 Tax=Salinarimonas soli TaxID=1638099 RepID=A0A5B2VEN7_9HYPH|nr:adenylate/guanylate cyclase domain-containing protein [Salinarimonas soli]KAA2236842.1 adenylate/guanylate cyclase domain-containing protein [Salinarimonas soli]